jgi:hypothetical protein
MAEYPEQWDDLLPQIIKASDEYRDCAANFGTAVHWWVNKKLRAVETRELLPIVPGAEEIADGLLAWLTEHGYEFSHTEHRFARADLGYAGTVDLVGTLSGRPCVVDLKTQEPPLTPHAPEYPLQLAGYDMAIEPFSVPWEVTAEYGNLNKLTKEVLHLQIPVPRERISLIANRLVPGEVREHIWIDKSSTVEQTNARYDRMWLQLVDLWISLNQYNPRSTDAIADPNS